MLRLSADVQRWLLVFFKGAAMGAADVVPGVSGGTIAFITGIYERLLSALKSLTPLALGVWYREGFAAFWARIDAWFLLTLFSGILFSVISLANIISFLLAQYPILIWSFFFGLVLASAIYLGSKIPQWQAKYVIAIIIGTLIALGLGYIRPNELPAEWWMMFIAGSVAICAMILPGISGSFILLLMGMYSVVINALQELDVVLLLSFVAGCFVGLIGFSHVLSWLLKRHHWTTLSLLTGFLLGSLSLLWPWKQVVETTVDRHGELIPLVQVNVLPHKYAALTQEPAYILYAVLCIMFGLLLVLLLERIGRNHKK